MIDVEGLAKGYQRVRGDDSKALDGVTVDVPDRMIFGFLRPNGAGKTIAIRVLPMTLPPAHDRPARSVGLHLESAHPGEGAIPGEEPLTMSLRDCGDEQVGGSEGLAPREEVRPDLPGLVVGLRVERKKGEGLQ